jgi:DNA invertase Pin-like site-specific DNA recombinase
MKNTIGAAKAVVYLRVSTDKQGRSGLGLEAQQEAVRVFLTGRGWTQIAEFVEVESGKNNDRPQLASALKRCRVTGAVLVVAKLDRLSRNLAFLANLMESKARFVCVDNPEANDLTIHILAAMAQHERKMISERTRAAMAAAKARGVDFSRPNLAKDKNTDPTKANAKRRVLAENYAGDMAEVIEDIKAEGIETLHGIAKELNVRDIATRRGGRWTATQVRRVVERAGLGL